MLGFLSRIAGIRRSELGITALMAANYYLVLVTYYFLKPARDSLFLVKVSPEQLPLVFILTALIAAPVTSIYARAGRTLRLDRLIYISVGVIIANLALLRYLVQLPYDWVYYMFYAWVSIFGALTTSQFWLLANAVFDAAQAKRVFVLLGLGGIVGAFTGGEVTSFMVTSFGVSTEDLLFFCMAFLAISAVLSGLSWRLRPVAGADKARRSDRNEESQEKLSQLFKLIFRSRHLAITVGIIAMTVMVASFVDYQFKTVSFQSFSEKAELTAFLGKFYGRLSLVSLALQMFLGYRVIRWLGVTGTITFLPTSLVIGSIAMIAFPALGLPLLWAGVLLRGGDGAIKYSLDKTGRELLFLPVPIEVKKRTKIFLDMFVDRWFRGFAGALLLLFSSVLAFSVQQISIVVLVLLVGWLVLLLMMRKEYVNSFRKAIDRRQIDVSDIRVKINDESTVNTLIVSLASENDRQVTYALEMLKSVKGVELKYPIIPLLEHKSAPVRLGAVEALRVHGDHEQIDQVQKLLGDPEERVRQAALGFLCHARPEGALEALRDFLGHQDPRVRYASLAHIAEHGDEEEQALITVETAQSILNDQSEHAANGRVQLAKVLGKLESDELAQYLRGLLEDENEDVVRAAIEGIGRKSDRYWIPWLVDKLADRRYRPQARRALAAYGESILGTLTDYLVDANTSLVVRKQVPRIIRSIISQDSVEALLFVLDRIEPSLQYHVIKALNKLRVNGSTLKISKTRVFEMMVSEAKMYYETLQLLVGFGEPNGHESAKLLKRALSEKLNQKLEQIFRLLGLVYSPKDVYNAYQGVTSKNKIVRANAVEFLDNLLRNDIKKYIFPIVESVVAEDVIRQAQRVFSLNQKSAEEGLADLIQGRDNWLRVCALYCAGQTDSPQLRDLVQKATSDRDPLVRETARWVLEGYK